ncbi:16819_t:CDS:2, partial [Gigaspora rosea]
MADQLSCFTVELIANSCIFEKEGFMNKMKSLKCIEGITSLAINKESALVLTGSTDGSDISSVDDKLNSWDVNTMRLRQTCHHE